MALPDLRAQAVRRSSAELLQHMNSFELDLRFTAGIWYFSPFAGRFHARYSATRSIEERLEIAAGLKDYGLVGLEAHYSNEINDANLPLWQ